MATVPDDGMLRPPGQAPLGAILVQRGVLTEEQLAAALAEQERTGGQLGEIIVRLGFAVPPMIGQGLATQYGGLLKTEYGYAVGFGGGTPPRRVAPPPVSPEPAEDERSARLRLVSGVRAAPAAGAPAPAPAVVEVPAALAASAQSAPDQVVLKWQQQAQELAAQRDAALRDLQALVAERAAFAKELEAATEHSAALEAAAARAETEREALARAHDEAASRSAKLERTLEELEAVAARVVELEATANLAESEKATLERALAEAASRNSTLERQLAELEAAAGARSGELATATARVAELETTSAANDSEVDAASADACEEAARAQMEKAALQEAHDAIASRNAHLEDRLKKLEDADARAAQLERRRVEAAAQIRQLEAERNDALALARTLGEQQREHDLDEHAHDPAHLLFIPVPDGYLLFQQQGPPPAPGSTLEFTENDGTSSRLVVAKLGAAPLPGVRLACAYLIEAD